MFTTERISWRLAKKRYAPGLDGLGARKVGGRWNPPGYALVYTSSSLALSVLETFVHMPPHLRTPEKFPAMVSVQLVLPEEAEVALCPLANPIHAPLSETQAAGVEWLRQGNTLAMAVPSFVIGEEMNLLLNTAHPHMESVKAEVTPFRYDARLGASG